MDEINDTNHADSTSTDAKPPRRYPVLEKRKDWRAADWPVLVGLQTLDEFAASAEMYAAELDDMPAATDRRVICIQLTAPESLLVLSVIHKLARDDPEHWGDAPKRRHDAVIEIVTRYGLILDAALKITHDEEGGRVAVERAIAEAEQEGIGESIEEIADEQ